MAKLRLLGGPAEHFNTVPICACPPFWHHGKEYRCQPRRTCWRCGNKFDLRRANRDESICGECVALHYSQPGGYAGLGSYKAAHPRHYSATHADDDG